MNNKGSLSNKQFITLAIIIVICGIAIIGHDYFLAKKLEVYSQMESLLLSQEPAEVEKVETEDPKEEVVEKKEPESSGDTSGRVERVNITYDYVGRLKIPEINLNRGFVKYGQAGNNVDQNIAIMSGSSYPTSDNSNLIFAAHSGSGWNAYFTKLDRLSTGAKAYVTYEGKQYTYKLVKIYSDDKTDGRVSIYRYSDKKQLTLITCKRPDYRKYYLVLVFELINEQDI